MKSLLYIPAILFLLISCSKDENLLQPATLEKPSAIHVFCQKTPDDTLKSIAYTYDNNHVISETTFSNGEFRDKTFFKYNSEKRLVLETFETYLQKTEKTYIYNDLNQLTNVKYKFTNYTIEGQIADTSEKETPREYENNLLVKEWEYWGGFISYEYSDARLITKVDHTSDGGRHHITSYKYSGNLLREEKKETEGGSLIYLKTYLYDSQNRLVQIRDGENIIEQNDYLDKKLIEKRTFYFGIDPGYDVCYGNYIFRYEY